MKLPVKQTILAVRVSGLDRVNNADYAIGGENTVRGWPFAETRG